MHLNILMQTSKRMCKNVQLRGPQYGSEPQGHSEGFTRSFVQREPVNDGEVSIAASQRTAMTNMTRVSKTTEPAHAFLEYTGGSSSKPVGTIG